VSIMSTAGPERTSAAAHARDHEGLIALSRYKPFAEPKLFTKNALWCGPKSNRQRNAIAGPAIPSRNAARRKGCPPGTPADGPTGRRLAFRWPARAR
jgi:hypothetical protein